MSSSQSYPVVTTFDKKRQVLIADLIIKNFKNITEKEIRSEIFSHPSAPAEWRMTVVPNGDNEASANHVSFYLKAEWKGFDSTATFYLGCEDKTGKGALRFSRLTNVFTKTKFGFGYSKFLTAEDVTSGALKEDGSLTLFVEIKYATLKWGPVTHLSRFKVGTDLGVALNGKHADVVFNVGNQSIKAHKVIITHRSKYFSAMFDNDTSEAQSGTITITDFEFGLVRGLLEFIYNGFIELTNVGFASSLRIAADKYEILDLVEICEEYIVANVNKKTAAKAILSTTLVESEPIRTACIEVFKKRVNFEDIDNFGEVFKDEILCKIVVDALQA